MKSMALQPRVSEKTYGLSLDHNTYVFKVPMSANKLTIAEAISVQFNVTVENVRVTVVKGKSKNSYRKGRRPVIGKRADFKKAYVQLKDGDSINVFGDSEEKKADKSEKAGAKLEKQIETKADTKPKRGLRGALSRTPRQTQNKGGGGK